MKTKIFLFIVFFLLNGITLADEKTNIVPPLSFVQALEAVISRNIEVQKQKALLEASRAEYLSTSLLFLPTISAQAQHLSNHYPGLFTSKRSLSVAAQMNLFKFGADSATVDAAQAEIKSLEYGVQSSLLSAEATGFSSLIAVIQHHWEMTVLKRILQSRQEALDIARKRFQKGLLASEESDAVAIDLENALAQSKDTEIALAESRLVLIRHLGHDQINLDWPLNQKIESSINQFPSMKHTTYLKRPDVMAAKEHWIAQSHLTRKSLGNIFPSLDLSFSYEYFRSESGGTNVIGPQWTGSIMLSIPLFDRLSNYSTYRSSLYRKSATEMDWEKSVREARNEFESTLSALTMSLQTVKSRDKTLELSRKLYEANLRRFMKGLINANELRTDQDRLYQSELLAVRGWVTVHNHFARLCHSMGQSVLWCPEKTENKETPP